MSQIFTHFTESAICASGVCIHAETAQLGLAATCILAAAAIFQPFFVHSRSAHQ